MSATAAAGAVAHAAARLAALGRMAGAAGLAGALALGGAAAAHAAIDPFYLDLLRDGIQSYDRGNYAAASK
ncbi:MAG TPA: hypothetical protein VHG32_24480, partial [Thermoanaerobaculia bacterium]|nr:hypothetical protein [Thermoanaerobaculia bacterium]